MLLTYVAVNSQSWINLYCKDSGTQISQGTSIITEESGIWNNDYTCALVSPTQAHSYINILIQVINQENKEQVINSDSCSLPRLLVSLDNDEQVTMTVFDIERLSSKSKWISVQCDKFDKWCKSKLIEVKPHYKL
jgi:hypothetical protein